LILAFIGLANDEPGMLSLVGGIAALLALVAIPLATGLLVNALLGDQKRHADALPGLRWPAANEICPRCGEVNFMPLFCCRHCGRLSWVWLAEVCAFAITAAAVVAISVPDYNAPAWWKDVGMLLHLLGALLAATAAFAVFIGTAQVWQLQPRLPKEGRVFRSKVDQMALVGATLVPVLCTALLVLSLF